MEDYPLSQDDLEERFSDDEACLEYLRKIRWPNGFVCPVCGKKKAWETKRGLYHCQSCNHQTSVTSGTIFHRSQKPLHLWFRAIWDVIGQSNGASARSIKRTLDLGSYQTAWSWLQKLRKAMIRPNRERLSGTVQVDETYLGGRKEGKRGRGALGKAIIAIAVEDKDGEGDEKARVGRVRLKHIKSASKKDLLEFLTQAVDPTSIIRTDDWKGYYGIEKHGYVHEIIAPNELRLPHLIASLLKRWILGTHQGAIRPSHLAYYLDEFTFRFNRRTSAHRGKLFFRLIENAVKVEPVPLNSLKAPNQNDKDDNFDDIYSDHNM